MYKRAVTSVRSIQGDTKGFAITVGVSRDMPQIYTCLPKWSELTSYMKDKISR